MPKSLNPLADQFGFSTTSKSQPSLGSNNNNNTNRNSMTSDTSSTGMADALGQKKDSNAIPQGNPSVVSSEGAIGRQFNPDGAIGQIGSKIGGPFAASGMIGKQFDASKDGIAGHVERAVDGPRNAAGSSGTQ